MNDPWFEMQHIVKEFPGVRALNDVSFAAEKGEVIGTSQRNVAQEAAHAKTNAPIAPSTVLAGLSPGAIG